jgi:hypothetical protein
LTPTLNPIDVQERKKFLDEKAARRRKDPDLKPRIHINEDKLFTKLKKDVPFLSSVIFSNS